MSRRSDLYTQGLKLLLQQRSSCGLALRSSSALISNGSRDFNYSRQGRVPPTSDVSSRFKSHLRLGRFWNTQWPAVGQCHRAFSATSSSQSSASVEEKLKGPIDKILIANRGEIACRVIKTAKRLGIKTVAVYSDADRFSMHVKSADEAVHIGPAPASLSYLSAEKILAAARSTNAKAIHPGYGFLSENVHFAESCKKEGIRFIGPPSTAIHAMGDKSVSKKLMEAAGVAVVPGYHGDDQDIDLLQSEARRIGYPVLIKATQGGGGKGMRIVLEENEFLDCLSSAQREAMAAFGDSRVLIEKYLTRPRHIEVQIFGDMHGNVVHLFERDCSVQRRHQKIIEEAPAPGISEEFRQQIGQAAVNAAKAVGYESAGTVEFIVDTLTGKFYFMEMNTRLQVEHPITEMVTGQDLVEWQILVANGEPLPLQQDQLQISGHAFEARIYAENVPRGFLPAAGTLHHYNPPPVSSTVRVETGVGEGDSVSVYYDPMIAKLVAWGHDRSAALVKLHDCLSKFQIAGLPTNIPFLKALAKHPAFVAGEVGTHFIDQYREELLPSASNTGHESSRAAVSIHLDAKAARQAAAIAAVGMCLTSSLGLQVLKTGVEGWGGWNSGSGFRLNHSYSRLMTMEWKSDTLENSSVPIKLSTTYDRNANFTVEVQGEEPLRLTVTGQSPGDRCRDLRLDVDGQSTNVSLAQYFQNGINSVHLWQEDQHYHFTVPWLSFEREESDDEQGSDKSHREQTYSTTAIGSVTAPMAGRVVKVLVENGARVKKGEPLLVLEAMKMEHVVRAPVEGLVDGAHLVVGQQVNDNMVLLQIKERRQNLPDEDDDDSE
ncbi:3-methylcrotonyl-CoA carboxylase alpha subunit [Marchantia polymorpha subsp. ruderalis]|uniref:Methylcrotonoyl-CoA carboxylase subunit alpha, mitochondrial n=1 Tax=Marchantia polymorpha TaxID=3197 RepID=A0A2R6W1H8_MARPO|nr:hypothetical protein MARPO_0187s0016 [Marchantia polymorpha]BBN19966.1 hypothetical protein Mp_8g15290 [Marchantia polymorpha subsp. ruderalis]|eukprot:PTQ27695.1 hypothetical protein MARPO_0187s0016 [Marchantia polymorpha]